MRGMRDEIPDPLSAATRASAVLDWEAITRIRRMRERLALTRALLDVRQTRRSCRCLPAIKSGGEASFDDGVLSGALAGGGEGARIAGQSVGQSAASRPETFWGEPIWGGEPPRDTCRRGRSMRPSGARDGLG